MIEPTHGTLAPNGGANNVCDPAKPYPDHAAVVVSCTAGGTPGDEALLVVGTEEEQWTFVLTVES